MQHIKEESSDDSPNKEGIVKFAFADVHASYRTLKIFLLSKPYKNRHVFAFDSDLARFSNRQQKLKAARREEDIHMRVNL